MAHQLGDASQFISTPKQEGVPIKNLFVGFCSVIRTITEGHKLLVAYGYELPLHLFEITFDPPLRGGDKSPRCEEKMWGELRGANDDKPFILFIINGLI